MKRTLFFAMVAIALASSQIMGGNARLMPSPNVMVLDEVQSIKPVAVEVMPDISLEEYMRLDSLVNMGKYDAENFYDIPVFSSIYFEGCSWYCGGWVDSIAASSHHSPEGRFNYEAANAHDFNIESVWATEDNGIGEYLTFTFAGNCPRITQVAILNGHAKTEKSWRNNSRVKTLLLYYNDTPYRLLELEDSRSLQYFDLDTLGYGPNNEGAPKWTLKFEIKEVYPGEKYDDAVIAEFIFDGIDVH